MIAEDVAAAVREALSIPEGTPVTEDDVKEARRENRAWLRTLRKRLEKVERELSELAAERGETLRQIAETEASLNRLA